MDVAISIYGCIRPLKTLSVHTDNGDFRVALLIQSHLRIRQKYFTMYGEYAKST
jgi:hypothetical protein